MLIENTSIRFSRLTGRLAIVLILLVGFDVSVANGQQPSTKSPKAVSLTSELLYKSPARLLYSGNNTIPTGKLNLITYRLEEVKLSQKLELSKNNSIDSVIRLVVTGEKFQPGEYTIWIGEQALTDVMRSSSELITVVFDRSILERGATIAVSYPTSGDSSRTILPDTLYVPAEIDVETRNADTSITRITKVRRRGDQSFVEIELTSERLFLGQNAMLIFQIGDFETYASNPPDGDGYKGIIKVPLEIYEKLEDNAPVFVKTERGKRGLTGARIITRLNKQLEN